MTEKNTNNELFIQENSSFKELDLNNFNSDALQVITNTEILNDEEKQLIASSSESMNKAFKNSQKFRTRTEAAISVLNDIKHPTDASKYFQSLRELNVHQGELVGLLFDYQKKQQEYVIIQSDMEKLYDKLYELQENNEKQYKINKIQAKINIKQIELNEIQFHLKNMRQAAIGRKDEIIMWHDIINELEPKLIEDGISIEDVNEHQMLSYVVRFWRQYINMVQSGSNNSSSVSEVNNLVGQLITSMKNIREQGLEEALLSQLSDNEKIFIAKQNGFSININKQILKEFEEFQKKQKEEKNENKPKPPEDRFLREDQQPPKRNNEKK